MMPKSIFLLTMLLTGALTAQEPKPTIPPLPPGPLLKRMPEFGRWTVVSQFSRGGSSRSNSTQDKDDSKKPKVVKQVTVVKTGKVFFELIVDDRGQTTQIWHNNGLQLSVPPNGVPTVCPEVGGGDIYTANYAISDFAGLDWISPASYAGMEKNMGRDCLVFKGDVIMLTAQEVREVDNQTSRGVLGSSPAKGQATAPSQPAPGVPKEPAVAYIDLETRLPIIATFGSETRVYQYGPAPTAMFTLPPDVSRAQQEFVKRAQRLSAQPARP